MARPEGTAAPPGNGVEPLPRTLAAGEFDVFLSYSRRDRKVAEALCRRLRLYRPPRSVAAPRRALRVFRDVDDIVGTVLEASIRRHLDGSARVVVLCSPAARASRYVDAEIRHYAAASGPERIVPVLVGGVPNAEAAGEEEMAFPEALLAATGNDPLAADFRGFDPSAHRVDRGRFRPAWFQLLANVYGIPQRELEARERARTRRRLATAAVLLLALGLAGGAWSAYARSDGYQFRRVLADAPAVLSQAGDTTSAAWLEALLSAGRHDAALAAARSIEDPYRRAVALSGLVPVLAAAGRAEEAAGAASGALAAGEAVPVAQDRARALGAAAAALAELGDTAGVARAAERALAAAQAPFTPADAADGRDYVLGSLATVLAKAGRAREALAAAGAMQGVPEDTRASTLGDVAAGLAEAGRRAEAVRTAEAMLAAAGADPWHRSVASLALLRVGEASRALAAARAIDAPDVRAFALSGLAAALAEARDARSAQVAREAVAAAGGSRDPVSTLLGVATELADAGEADGAARAAVAALARLREALPGGRPTQGAFPLDDPLSGTAAVLARTGRAEDALAAAGLIGLRSTRYVALDSVAAILVARGQARGALDAVRAIDDSLDASFRASAFRRVAAALADAGEAAGAAQAAREGLATARGIAPPYDRVTALGDAAAALDAAGDAQGAGRAGREALAAARAVEDPYLRALALRTAAVALVAARAGEAAGAVREAAAAARKAGDAEGLGLLAAALAEAGNADAAARMAGQALEAARALEAPSDRVSVLRGVAAALAAAGSREAAARVALAADSVALRMTDPAERSAALSSFAATFAGAGWLWRARAAANREMVLPDDRLRAYTAILLEYGRRARPPPPAR